MRKCVIWIIMKYTAASTWIHRRVESPNRRARTDDCREQSRGKQESEGVVKRHFLTRLYLMSKDISYTNQGTTKWDTEQSQMIWRLT